ncbi:bifunctional 2-polyprenyl-6-hydroxyphenol methylase/3-demethylubiquinol 3-O-methyltransferase UbiG [Bdellovibrio reynosensis]|uniref:Bifunctional 2-polyprenyl-6-hydroxyphenol methylase/3-demethylubiquinol 3-O-methyltransferase UbiG n=1 Tax=Bdellovibrio reynosensis TaxID=2835041 RepID=A0ABY4C799_9BACT|nr:bifunctional 2-polyprenyl-6-hydroxyphenol methylase/3-demethylubiquinol 3-O-methyltransferase UbiG [Bdellovibrio reynosensis]UOF00679.1 bifunctional 2-polyprenyl-6-hydroxyphenol methylase/3-demethylubiquinol 3-O-methyltransferase UbiG [Bdellovibrio reynosensis]
MEMDLDLAKLDKEIINNDAYDSLADRWYEAQDDPIALLRNQHKTQVPWILDEIRRNIGYHAEVLDMGCGAGFLSNDLAAAGHSVTGIDLSTSSLKIAETRDRTRSVKYRQGDVYQVPFPRESFDVVTAMDLLEHVSDPKKVLAEATRVLRPGGLFFYNTFHKNPLAWLVVIKGMEWFVKNTPDHYHVYSLFIRPKKLESWMDDVGLDSMQIRGIRPVFAQKALFKLLATGVVPSDFKFKFSRSPLIAYIGVAKKLREH